ncbi:Quino protein amine dehydrogenase [Baffinella frigidus]|nr:Quino protein amine dehydrogenase [Cryptophyta sp. CCMP2293]
MLALGLQHGRVMLVHEATGKVKWESAPNFLCVSSVAMSPNGRFVASVSSNTEHWTLWDAVSGAVNRVGATHDGTAGCICRADRNNMARRLLEHGCPALAHTTTLNAVVFSPCGSKLVTGGAEHAVIVWDAETGEAERRMQGNPGGTHSLSFSGDGARLASGNIDGGIFVWDATTGAVLHTIPRVHQADVKWVHFSPCRVHFSPTDSRRLASASTDATIHLRDVDSGKKLWSIEGLSFAVFSPDGRSIATKGRGEHFREVHLVDAESGALRFAMVGAESGAEANFYESDVRSVAFSPDGSRLVSGSVDRSCKVWDASTGALLQTSRLARALLWLAWGRDWVREKLAFAMGHPLPLAEMTQDGPAS